MGFNPIPEPSSSVKAAAELNKIQEDLRQIAGGSISPDAKAELFKDAQSRLQALQNDKGIPQGIRDAIPGVLKDLAGGSAADVKDAMKTIARLGPNITPIQPDGGKPNITPIQPDGGKKHPVSPGPFPEPLPGNLGPGGTEKPRVGPGGTQPIVGPGGTEKPRVGPGGTEGPRLGPGGTEKPRVGPGGTEGPRLGPGGTEDPRVGPGGLPPKR